MTAQHKARIRKMRSRERGFVAVDEFLSFAALLGCFVVPVAVAATTAGPRLVEQMDAAHETILEQP